MTKQKQTKKPYSGEVQVIPGTPAGRPFKYDRAMKQSIERSKSHPITRSIHSKD